MFVSFSTTVDLPYDRYPPPLVAVRLGRAASLMLFITQSGLAKHDFSELHSDAG